MFSEHRGGRWGMRSYLRVSVCAHTCRGHGVGHMPSWCPAPRNSERGTASSDPIFKKSRNAPAKSPCLFNVPELPCRKPVSMLAHHAVPSAAARSGQFGSARGRPGLWSGRIWITLYIFFLFSFWFWLCQGKRRLPRDSIISLQNSLGIILTIKKLKAPISHAIQPNW